MYEIRALNEVGVQQMLEKRYKLRTKLNLQFIENLKLGLELQILFSVALNEEVKM